MDFKELPQDGQAFEQLVRELLFSNGLHVAWSGKGPDGGRDLICTETIDSHFVKSTRTWLVQCKHKAHSGDSVGIAELDNIVDSCTHHHATGYILVCSTQPSSAVVNRLESVTNNPANSVTATYWDGVMLQRMLSAPRLWAIAQRFMPKSCGEWQIYATEAPNDFVAHHKGYVFHLSNRIGSSVDYHLPSISRRIEEIEKISFPKDHFIRPRSVWYNDKSGEYVWYVDYMRPHDEKAAYTKAMLADMLHDGWALEDGQMYSWDIKLVKYSAHSDHYDSDHYDYYTRYLPNFISGTRREAEVEEYWQSAQEARYFEKEEIDLRHSAFNAMADAFKRVPFLAVVRSINASCESVVKLERRFDWSDLADELDFQFDNVFTATLTLDVEDVNAFFSLLEKLPNDVMRHFRASRVYIFLPETGLNTGEDEFLFDVRFTLHPAVTKSQRSTRIAFNEYFAEITAILEQQFPVPLTTP